VANLRLHVLGTIKPAWAARLDKVVKACDRLGMVVVLGLFYGKQSGTFTDEAAVKAAVTNTVDWLVQNNATNVLLEIGNEVDLENVWAHPIIAAGRCHELIALAQQRSDGRLLVSTSLIGIDAPPAAIVAAADFLLPHGNRVYGPGRAFQPSPHGIRLQLARWRGSPAYRGQPIVYNEDDHFEFDKPTTILVAAVEGGASWGYFDYRMSRERFEDGFPVAAGRLDDLVPAQARLLRASEGNHRKLRRPLVGIDRQPIGQLDPRELGRAAGVVARRNLLGIGQRADGDIRSRRGSASIRRSAACRKLRRRCVPRAATTGSGPARRIHAVWPARHGEPADHRRSGGTAHIVQWQTHSSVGDAAVSYWMAPHRQCPFSIRSSTRRDR
jgi:hypothetical protein